jgi:hypothetical protein
MADDLLGGIFGAAPEASAPEVADIFGATGAAARDAVSSGSQSYSNPDVTEIRGLQADTGTPMQRLTAKLNRERQNRAAGKSVKVADQISRDYEATKPAETADNYLVAKGKSGLSSMASVFAGLINDINPYTTSDADLAVLYKDDPRGLEEARNSSAGFLGRLSRSLNDKSERQAANISFADESKFEGLSYATLDPKNAAYLSPTRVLGDAIQSLPTTAALALTAYLTKGAASKAEATALAGGATEAEAQALGVKAAQQMASRFGAASEGALGYEQQRISTQSQYEHADVTSFPEYQELVKQGFDPSAAKIFVASRAGQKAGIGAGVVDAVTNLVGGKFLGEIIGEGGTVGKRALKGAANEGATEFVQSAGEQASANMASPDPTTHIVDGVLESAVQGLSVGALTGSGSSAAFGHSERAAAPVAQPAPVSPMDLPDDAVLTPDDHASPIPNDVIAAGRKAVGSVLDPVAAKARVDTFLSDPTTDAPTPEEAIAALNAHRDAPIAGTQQAPVIPPSAQPSGDVVGDFVRQTGAVESGNNPTAKNPTSSATGTHQFVKGTWLSLMRQARPDQTAEMSDDQILALRNNPLISAQMAAVYARQNANVPCKRTGTVVDQGTLYLSHFLGSGGANALLSADPSAPVEQILQPGQIAANRTILAGKTAADVIQWAYAKMKATPAAAPDGTPVAPATPEQASESVTDFITRVLGDGEQGGDVTLEQAEDSGDIDGSSLTGEAAAPLQDDRAAEPFAQAPPPMAPTVAPTEQVNLPAIADTSSAPQRTEQVNSEAIDATLLSLKRGGSSIEEAASGRIATIERNLDQAFNGGGTVNPADYEAEQQELAILRQSLPRAREMDAQQGEQSRGTAMLTDARDELRSSVANGEITEAEARARVAAAAATGNPADATEALDRPAAAAISEDQIFDTPLPKKRKYVAPTRQAPRQRAEPNSVDVLTFLADHGGLASNTNHSLRKNGREMGQYAKGGGQIFRKDGMSIDDAGELLHDSGWFPGGRPTEADVLDLLSQAEQREVYHPEHAAERALANAVIKPSPGEEDRARRSASGGAGIRRAADPARGRSHARADGRWRYGARCFRDAFRDGSRGCHHPCFRRDS